MNLRTVFLMVALPLLLVVGAALLLTPRDILRQPVIPGTESSAPTVSYYTSSVKRPPDIAIVEFEEAAIPPPQLVVVATPLDVPATREASVERVADRRWTTARGLNVRTGPSVQEKLVASLPFGTPVSVLETSGTWAHVEAGDVTGWLSANFLSREDPSAN